MSMEYIRDRYSVPATRGGRVRVKFRGDGPRYGTIKFATHYLHLQVDGQPKSRRYAYHPKDVEYLMEGVA